MTYKQSNRYVCVMIVCLLVALSAGGRCIPSAFADTSEYTSALTDLQKDDSFTAADYSSIANDYTIQVIQIAESTRGELFVYTYQPCQEATRITATKINMSLSDSPDGTKLYALTLINAEGVFCKYVVDLFIASTVSPRYYNITSIYRKWIDGVDKESGTDNTINGVAFAVGKCYKVTTENGKVMYKCRAEDVVQIINPYADFLQYNNGYKLNYSACRSHYVAFSTDKQIDTLKEATVAYDWETLSQSGLGDWKSSGVFHDEKTISGEETGENPADGWFGKKYEWKRIQSINEFKETEDLTDETTKNLGNAQWILRFLDTELIVNVNGGVFGENKHTDVTNVSVLRLKFVTDGKVYNLGAVSNAVTGDDRPGNNNTNEFESLFDLLERLTGIPKWFWILLFVLIVLAICLPILSAVFPPFGHVMLVVLKGIWWVICAPFKGIAALVQKIKDKKDGGQ